MLTNILMAQGTAAGAGLFAVALAGFINRRRNGGWSVSLASIVVSFLGGALLPFGTVLVLYPFLAVKPNLTEVVVYLPIAGIAILWASVGSIAQAALPATGESSIATSETSGNEPAPNPAAEPGGSAAG